MALFSQYFRVLVSIIFMFGFMGFSGSVHADSQIINTATANFSIYGANQQVSDSAEITKESDSDELSLSKKVNKSQALIGETLAYTLVVKNPYNITLNNLVIKDTLPTGLNYIESSAKQDNNNIADSQIAYNGNQLDITLGNIPANSEITLQYQAKVSQGTPYGYAKNQAIAVTDTTSSSQAFANVIIRKYQPPVRPDPTVAMQLTKSADKSHAKVGEIIHYTLGIKNTNSKDIQTISVEDTLPAGLVFQAGSAKLNSQNIADNAINHNSDTHVLTFNLGDISANSEWTVSYDALVSQAIDSPTLVNQAKLTASDNKANSTIVKNTVTIDNDKLIISKQADQQRVNVGGLVTYTVTVKNPSLHTLNHLVINDLMPAGFNYQTGSLKVDGASINTQPTINGNQMQIQLGSLTKGKTLTISYQVKINERAKSGSATNQVQANSDHASSDMATATIKVSTPSVITFLKIDETGTDGLIPSTSFNNSKNNGKQWQLIDQIKLTNGSVINLPTPQPLLEAQRYSLSEPVVIEVKDFDQNNDSKKLETIIVTIQVPGTNDTETLLLTEISADSGIFRGVLLTSPAKTQPYDGQLSVVQGSKINVSYRDEDDASDTSATAALVTPKAPLLMTKSADKDSASIGELIRYTLAFSNTSNLSLPALSVTDTLPVGLRYVAGSASLNGKNIALNSKQLKASGRSLLFNLDHMPTGEEWQIEYLAKVSSGVQTGKVVNQAFWQSGSLKSNIARATVTIKDDLMRSKNILTGRVYIGCNTKTPKVLKDARIYMETGRSILSDEEGFWHMENIEPGSHVLQLDTESLPQGYTPLLCEDNTRHAGDAKSQFVNLQAGSLWQVDFYVKAGSDTNNNTNEGSTEASNNNAVKAINPVELYNKEYLKTAPQGFDILWPKNNYVPAVASTKILIKSSPQHLVEVYLNDKKVSPLNYDGSDTNKARTVTIRRWVGVDIDIKEPNNTLLVIAKDKSGKEVARQTRNIHFSGEAASAKLVSDQSTLIADGKTMPVIAILVKDKDGFPMRANTHGYFTLENSQYQVKTQNNSQQGSDLNESTSSKHKYFVDHDGIARIKLNPSSQSGVIKLKLHFAHNAKNNNTTTISAWMKPQLRDWIVVGIADGTIAHKTLSGNLTTLNDLDKGDTLYKRGRVALFAKGRVKGKYLLTMAYDSHKNSDASQTRLEQDNNNIDPDQWYTVYADNSSSQYNATSSRKLYLKIEKDNFYALFGDYRTGLTVSKLANYERTLNGLQSKFNGERISYNAFISETSNHHHHQEIPGDGSSGLYRLNNDIIANSETIKIETRDRFHSENIIKTRSLTRYQDYDIDYDAGTLFFKFPVTGRDQNFNPNIIVVDYDSESNSSKNIIAGGRIAATSKDKKLEVGVSALHINRKDVDNDSLVAIDATYKLNNDTKIHAEIAQSKSIKSDGKNAQAEIIEIEKSIAGLEAKVYFRKQEKNFGIDNQGISENGTKKMGAELRYKLSQKTELNAEVSHQKNTSNDNTRQLASATIKHRLKQAELSAGLRHSKEQLDGNTINNDTALLGGKYTLGNGKVTLRTNIEKNLNSNDSSEPKSELSPDRITVGMDLNVGKGFTLFAEHENTDNGTITTQNNRIGLSKSLWTGAKAKTTYTQEKTAQGQRDYATLGLSQTLKLSKKIKADFSIDHAKTIGEKLARKERFNVNEPVPQGTQRDDYTTISVGLGSTDKLWSWTTRFEVRKGDLEDKINFRAGISHQLDNGKQVSGKIAYYDSDKSNGDNSKVTKLSLGTAWHPKEKDFVFFSRLDLIEDKQNLSNAHTQTRKIIHNMHYSRKINSKTQISVHHGIKHIIDDNKNNQATRNTATVDTGTVEVRRDINKKWDVSAHAGYLHDWDESTTETLAGVAIGVTPAKDMWLSLGYNFEGFDDKDFDDNNYKRKGAFLSFSYKFNQDSFRSKHTRIEEEAEKAAQ